MVIRGEVWWARLPFPRGPRPVVLVSRQKAIEVRSVVAVVEVTTRARGLKTEVPLGAEEGLPRPCVANADVLNNVPKEILDRPIGKLNATKLTALGEALKYALGLDDS